ncbi:hypothetical protein [Micromonospora sp. WMMD1082]|uniref:hypothetical protein n=1 Tax=Micromonospora sp. WMMD1082 TaxID=3016104 RepID=UPI0024173DC6|nr:hypothetical protein [Micromonospora sp. WMMD1082]MDG4792722.1 hypothetical protein [Micromonospora sp. WMMD1082]
MTPEDLSRFADAMRTVAERLARALAVATRAANFDTLATLQRAAARRQGQVVCNFPHGTLDPAHPGGAFAACPACGAAL